MAGKENVDVSKKFTRWLDKLVKDDLIALDGENIVPLSKRGNVWERCGKGGGSFTHGLLRQRIF
ncbi:hypothetical protein DWG24_01995 [Dickeya zeae]|uniref:Uncharacterized protein n=1 Tax=Dickeya zeae TaxID=204042 RepID=A0AAE6YWC4_9GAMM|nr:hypothetical protein DWG24_01995 [Dickeya zeae]